MTLDEALDAIQCIHKDECDSSTWWLYEFPWAVSTPERIVAFFHSEKAAFHYRMMLINQLINEGWDKEQEK